MASFGSMDKAFQSIRDERARQHRLKVAGKFKHLLTDEGMGDFGRLKVLGEEFGEVCRALQDEPDNLRNELVDLAAVATAWIQWLDRSDPK